MSNFVHARTMAQRHTSGNISSLLLNCFPELIAIGDDPDPAYRDVDFTGPIMATWKEASIINALVQYVKPRQALEIGTAVGWTAAHIASGMSKGGLLTCLDPFVETATGLGPRDDDMKNRFIDNMARCGFTDDQVWLVVGESPANLAAIAPVDGWDFVFLDGWHKDDQPMRDIQGVLPHLSAKAVIVMHDMHMPDVQAAGRFLADIPGNGTDKHSDEDFYFMGFLSRYQLGVFVRGVYTAKGQAKLPRWWADFQNDVSRIFITE